MDYLEWNYQESLFKNAHSKSHPTLDTDSLGVEPEKIIVNKLLR